MNDCKDFDSLKKFLGQFIDQMEHQSGSLDEQSNNIQSLQNENDVLSSEIHDLKERVLTSERYSSKSCLIFLGIQASDDPWIQVEKLINEQLGICITKADIAACHYLPGAGNSKPIKVKFIYNWQRDEVYRRRFAQRNLVLPNNRKIFIVERLPETDWETVEYAKSKGAKYTTNKCQVFVQSSDDKWLPANDKYDVDDIMSGVKKDSHRLQKGTSIQKPVISNNPKPMHTPSLKRKTTDDKLDVLLGLMTEMIRTGMSPPCKKTNDESECNGQAAA